MVRCANTGISGWIDAFGRTRQQLSVGGKVTDVQATLVADLVLPQEFKSSLFTRFGYFWLWILAIPWLGSVWKRKLQPGSG